MSPNSGRFPKSFAIYIFIVISIILLIIPENISNHVKVTIASPLAPLQKIIFQTGNFFKKIAFIMKSADERAELEEKVFRLQNKIIKQQNALNVLNKKLGTVSEFRKKIDNKEKPLMADLIAYDASNFRRSILIDIGSKQGVSFNDVVVFGDALVGRISTIGRSSSRVMLITDPASNIPARFLKSRIQGIVQGTANNKCLIKYIPRQVEVKKGDKVISSGVGRVFPKSIYIGDVVGVKKRSASLFKDIKLKPRIDFSKIEHVLVIKKNKDL